MRIDAPRVPPFAREPAPRVRSPGSRRVWRTAGLWLSVALLLLSASLGLTEGFDGVRDAETPLQRAAAGCQLAYGVAAVGGLWALFSHARWYRVVFAIWAFALTATAALAPVAWGGEGLTQGFAAGVAGGLVAGLGVWGAFAHLRHASSLT